LLIRGSTSAKDGRRFYFPVIEECGYNTTGQVYHHLKPLLAADLIMEDDNNRGCYFVQPHRVQGVIMLLAGISDMLDTKYTQGDWE